MAKKLKLPDSIQLSDDFKAMLDLLAVYTGATNELQMLESQTNEDLLEIIDHTKGEYADLQQALTQSETALEVIALRHPEWFTQKQSITTPYGTVKFYNGTKLEVANPEVSVLLIRQKGLAASEVAESAGTEPAFKDEQFVRVTEALNMEALEALSDAELREFRIRRVPNKSFSVKPAKVDMGKAVKEAAEVAA